MCNIKRTVGVAVLGDPENKNCNKINNVGAGLASARAITLITLVITIVILIILASITINLILRDNGLFEKVKQAKIDLEISEERENIQLAYLRSNRY
jgi:type II secretory pathway pseudopilin PulG